jgi:hypothetical protein
MDSINFPMMTRAGLFNAQSYNADANTVDLVWTAGATVRRRSYSAFPESNGQYDEQLIVAPKSVRMDRLNSGAPFLDSHDGYSLSSVIGSVVPGSARLDRGQGFATVMLSRAQSSADIVQNIRDGIIRNVSVGYRIYSIEQVEQDSKIPLVRVVDWEPVELSAVAVGADAAAVIRSEKGEADSLFPCVIVRAGNGRSGAPALHAAVRMRMVGRQARLLRASR